MQKSRLSVFVRQTNYTLAALAKKFEDETGVECNQRQSGTQFVRWCERKGYYRKVESRTSQDE